MVTPNRTMLSGTVELDETYIGGKIEGGKVGRGSENKTIVAVAIEINGAKVGRARLETLKDASFNS